MSRNRYSTFNLQGEIDDPGWVVIDNNTGSSTSDILSRDAAESMAAHLNNGDYPAPTLRRNGEWITDNEQVVRTVGFYSVVRQDAAGRTNRMNEQWNIILPDGSYYGGMDSQYEAYRITETLFTQKYPGHRAVAVAERAGEKTPFAL